MIQIDRFKIEGQSYGWQVVETVTTTKKDGTGTGTREVLKYYPTLKQCLESIADKALKDADSLPDVLARLEQMQAWIDEALAIYAVP